MLEGASQYAHKVDFMRLFTSRNVCGVQSTMCKEIRGRRSLSGRDLCLLLIFWSPKQCDHQDPVPLEITLTLPSQAPSAVPSRGASESQAEEWTGRNSRRKEGPAGKDAQLVSVQTHFQGWRCSLLLSHGRFSTSKEGEG